jgi:hypothetical protein
MLPDRKRISPARNVTGLKAYKGRVADILSALFLLFAILLTGGYAPQTVQSASVPATSQSPADLGAGSHRSVPIISKQQFFASETRDAKAAPWDDGKPKTFLPAKAFELADLSAGIDHATRSVAIVASIAASPYDARAPPVRS